jgi:hypothetical protein
MRGSPEMSDPTRRQSSPILWEQALGKTNARLEGVEETTRSMTYPAMIETEATNAPISVEQW